MRIHRVLLAALAAGPCSHRSPPPLVLTEPPASRPVPVSQPASSSPFHPVAGVQSAAGAPATAGRVLEGPTTPVSVRIGVPSVLGAVRPQEIAETVRYHASEIGFCYEKALATRPDLVGGLVVSFTIAGDGAVTEARVARSNLGVAVDRCVVRTLRRLWFTPTAGGGPVRVIALPLDFSQR